MDIWIILLAFCGYIASVLILYRHKKPAIVPLVMAMSTGIIAHLLQVAISLHGIMYDVSVTNVLMITAVCMTIIGAIRYFTHGDSIAYTVVALVAAVCLWVSVFIKAPLTAVYSWSLKIHIMLSIAAYIALGFAALYACFLLLQDYRLRKRRRIFRLNLPLNYIERTMMSFTIFGEILLTLSLATGVFFIHDLLAQHISHKVLFGAISWLIIAIALLKHYRQGFRGRQAATWLLSGFAFLALAYFGSAFVLQIILYK